MAKTATKPKKQATKPPVRKPGRKRSTPEPWYRRTRLQSWGVIAAIVAVAAFALLSGGEDRPEGAVSLPVVGADLHSLVVDPTDPSRVFIGSHSGVSVTEDGGKEWRIVDSLNGADAMGWAFAGDSILVGGHPGIYASSDGGKTFEQRNNGLPATDIHALGAGGDTVYAASPGAGLLVSDDAGASWQVASEDAGQGFMGRILVDPEDPQHLVAPDMSAGAVESTDGGRSWSALGGIQGAAWVSWDPRDTRRIVVTGMGSAAISADGGETWDAFEAPSGASLVEFSPKDPDTLYAAVLEDPNARVYVSRDGGREWDEL